MATEIFTQQDAPSTATDPYLRAGSVTVERIEVCGFELPPILHGLQPGQDLEGEPKDYDVSVIHISRRQVDDMLEAIEQQHPDLAQPLKIIRGFILCLDNIREESKLSVLAGLGWVKKEPCNAENAFFNLETAVRILGRWHKEHRLILR